MATPLTISAERREGAMVLIATGEIDLSNVEAFESALVDASAEPDTPLSVDLSGIEYLDSGGINILFAHADRIHVIANPVLMPVLKISGLTDVASVESAGD